MFCLKHLRALVKASLNTVEEFLQVFHTVRNHLLKHVDQVLQIFLLDVGGIGVTVKPGRLDLQSTQSHGEGASCYRSACLNAGGNRFDATDHLGCCQAL
jgi:hypothetical protein